MATKKSTGKPAAQFKSIPTSPTTSTHPLPDLMLLWTWGDLTAEQMVGHLLQHLIEMDKRLRAVERRP